MAAQPLGTNDLNTKTPIKHVIVIYGENRSFDHLFGTYRLPSGDSVMNILSEGIVNADGTPGPNFEGYAVSGGWNRQLQHQPPEDRGLQDLAAADCRRDGKGQRYVSATLRNDPGGRQRGLWPAAA
ncbi:MAG: alkaline phosphatase family protein [Rhodopila sp.]